LISAQQALAKLKSDALADPAAVEEMTIDLWNKLSVCGIDDQTPSTGGLCRGRGYGPGYGWILQQSSSGFSDLAPLILHYNWF
jgi:hypothetical protein